jgi:D-alanyl-D-alanine carboxypeptidase (penicillin-binding protein 5/6)
VGTVKLRAAGVLVLLAAGYLAFNYLIRPIPAVAATGAVETSTTTSGTAPTLPWPSPGEAAVSVSSLGFIATSGNEKPAPAASIAKVMTALVVIGDKPLKIGEDGPTIAITDADVQEYESDKAAQQSVVEVRAGEQLTERQALQALLIPSANNIAFTLANWDAGSATLFVAKMNKLAKKLGMNHTKFADAAGASDQTVSTPTDLLALGVVAMNEAVLAQIVATSDAKLPVAGTVYNVDYALGQSGIIGIKTGSGFGANFLFAASITLGGFTKTIYGCVMGLPTLDAAFAAAKAIIAAMTPQLHIVHLLSKYVAVGSYELPWGGRSDLLSTANVDLLEWPGMILRQSVRAPALTITKPVPPGTAAGVLNVVLGDYNFDVPLTTSDAMYPPGRFWRLTRV